MSKSITNQRYIFKIHSSRFRNNNWVLNSTIEEGKRNDEIVPLGDSITLRMIRKITKNGSTEDDIKNKKEEIKKLKKEKNAKNNRDLLKNKYKELESMTFISEYISIVFDSIEDWRVVNSKKTKIFFNGTEYLRLLGTNGGVKKNTVVFCRRGIYDELNKKLNNGRDVKRKYVPAKFESYKALPCSASTPVSPPRGVLVIKDGETIFKDRVLQLSDNKKGGFNLNEIEDYEIHRAFTDGCGMISKELAEQWMKDLNIIDENENAKYISSGFNIRNSWCKGMVFTFPFLEFAKEVAKKYEVEDAWGNSVDIRKVDLVITTNMLKLWDSYDSIEHYLSCCMENDFEFCVAKVLPKKLESIRNMNYQFLQSYDFSDEDIDKLIEPTVKSINGVLGEDYVKTLLFLKGCKITKEDFENEEFDFVKALMINGEVINDTFIKQKIYRMLKKKINDAKKGVIQVSGNYSIVSGDLYALCQWMFGMKVTGLLKKDEFYSRTWLDKGVKKVVAFRAPMTVHNNIRIFNFVDNKEVKKWYRYMRTCTILNAWDTTMDALNGCDMDGDAVITTDNEVLLRNTKNLLPIVCEQKVAEKKKIKENLLRDANKNGFGNDVGGVTNKCTGMYDVISQFEHGTKEYQEMMYRIICMQGYQQEVIDSIKGIIAKEVPKYWYDYKELKINETKDSKEISQWKLEQRKYVSHKKPYFFIYNYPHVMSKYKNYIKNSNTNSLIRFGLTVDDLRNKQNRTEEEESFLNAYDYKMPISLQRSTMNKICWRLEEVLTDIKENYEDSFNEEFYKSETEYSKATYKKVYEVYLQYKLAVKQYNETCGNIKKTEKQEKRKVFKERFEEKVFGVCSNEDILCNILIDMCYKNNENKQFVWDVCGDKIIKNLLVKNNNKIKYPVLSHNKSDTEWNGEHYKLIEVYIIKDEEDI